MNERKTTMTELLSILKKLDIEEPEKKAEKMLAYLDAVLKANEQMNLTAIKDRDEAIRKHLIDSLSCAYLEAFRTGSKKEADTSASGATKQTDRVGRRSRPLTVVDVGTGGGFPGAPLAIAFPDMEFTLIDSQEKKLRVVEEICNRLEIDNIQVFHGRAEDLAREEDHRDYYVICISRAVASMQTLCELCLPFVRKGGCFIAYKGSECVDEVRSAAKAMDQLKGRLVSITPQPSAEGMERHSLVVLEKIGVTDPRYPRKAGMPGKRPL